MHISPHFHLSVSDKNSSAEVYQPLRGQLQVERRSRPAVTQHSIPLQQQLPAFEPESEARISRRQSPVAVSVNTDRGRFQEASAAFDAQQQDLPLEPPAMAADVQPCGSARHSCL